MNKLVFTIATVAIALTPALPVAVAAAAAGPGEPLSISEVSADNSDGYTFTPPVTAPQTIHYND
ncbi:hypothetical protein ACWDUN_26770 [Mycobacterium sp. NPDC003323]